MEVRLVDHMGSDLSVVNAARVSFAKTSEWDSIPDVGPVEGYLQVGDENKYFPDRKMVTGRYDINKVYQRKYETIVSYISQENLTFGRYSLGNYLKEEYRDIEYSYESHV